MSRALALLLLLGAACFSAAGAVSEAAAAGASVSAFVQHSKNSPTRNPGDLLKQCCATLTVNGQTLNLFEKSEIPSTSKTIFIPPAGDNTETSCLNIPAVDANGATTWVTQFFDLNQLLIIELRVDAGGKVSLSYLVNSVSHHAKMDLHKAQIVLKCNNTEFNDVVGFLPDHYKTNFPHEIKTTFSKVEKTFIMDIHSLKTDHHCSLHKAVWNAAVCSASDGPCCGKNGRYLPGPDSNICRKSYSPCIKDTYCDGNTATCPDIDFQPNNTKCGWNAHQGELYSVAAIQHTRTPASAYAAVAVASTSGAKPTSYEDLELCTGTCNAYGTCMLGPTNGCCREQSYGYYDDYGDYGKEDYGKYAKEGDYGKDDKYGKDNKYGKDDYKGKDSYDKYGKDDYDKYGKKEDDYDKYGKKEDDYNKYGKKEDDYYRKDSYGKDDYDKYGKDDGYGKYGKKDSYAAIASANGDKNTPMISCFTP